MLALAGLPGTAGFIGKLYLIEAAVEADFTWLGVAIAIGTMISLGYYLRVIAAVWMRPGAPRRIARRPNASCRRMAGGSPEADREAGSRRPRRRRVAGDRCLVILGRADARRRGHGRLRGRPLAARRLGAERGGRARSAR